MNSNVNESAEESHSKHNSSFLHSGDEKSDDDKETVKTDNFQLKLRGKNLDNLDFLNKFLR
jgi:hypothetical protein